MLNGTPAVTLAGGWLTMTNCVASPCWTVKLLVVTEGSVAALTINESVPTSISLRPEKVATPLTAVAEAGPMSVRPDGLASVRVPL